MCVPKHVCLFPCGGQRLMIGTTLFHCLPSILRQNPPLNLVHSLGKTGWLPSPWESPRPMPNLQSVREYCRSWPFSWVLAIRTWGPLFMRQALYHAFTAGSVALFFFTSMPHWFIYRNFVVSFEFRKYKFTNSLLCGNHSDSSESFAFILEFGTCLSIWGFFEMHCT